MRFINRSESDKKYEKEWGGIPENNEMNKLIVMLCKADIPFDLAIHFGRPQVIYPSVDNRICDAICHWGSYGHENGLLEIMGLCDGVDDDVVGWLTAEEVFEKISEDWKANK